MSKLEKRINDNEELAREIHKLKINYLKSRDDETFTNERVQKQTEPIVTPIVEAIKNSNVMVKKTSLSQDEVRGILTRIKSIGVDRLKRNKYIQAIASMYNDDNLFNTFLTLNKDGSFTPPVTKMRKYGLVNSIIFYGQGGTSLDNLLGEMQTERFKKRLGEFDEFYEVNAKTIREANIKVKKPTQRGRRIMLSESEDMEQTEDGTSEGEFQRQDVDSVTSDDELMIAPEDVKLEERSFTGKGINGKQALINRLHTLHSSKTAGNTSLELNNEGQNILKTLLKRGIINKTKYYELEKLF